MLALYTFHFVSGENIPHIPKTSYKRKQNRRIYATCTVDDGESKHLALLPNSTITITSAVNIRLYAEHSSTDDKLIASKNCPLQEMLSDQPVHIDLTDERGEPNVMIRLILRITAEGVSDVDSSQLTTTLSLPAEWKRMDRYVRLLLGIGSVPAEFNPVSKAILKLLSIGADELFKRLEYNDAVLSLVEELGQASEHALDLHDSFSDDQRTKQKAARDALIMQIYRCLTFLRSLTKSSIVTRLSSETHDTVQAASKGLKACMKAVELKGNLDTQLAVFRTERLAKELVDERALEYLPHAKEVYAGTTRSCLPGTRVNLLREIEEWAFDPDGQRALVLYGAAGKGKSAVANAVAMRLRGAGIYAPFFAFDRTARNLQAYQLLPTLAVQLARRNQRYHDALCRIEVDDLSTRDIKDQSDQLVVGLLAGHSDFTPLVMIIDALDECPDEDATDAARSLRLATDRRALLETLSALITDDRLPPNLRLLITTRPDDDIRLYIAHPASPVKLCSIDDAEGTDRDIRLFVENKLSRTSFSGMVDDVVTASQTLFECAALLCRELTKACKPRAALPRGALVARVMRSPGQALYTTYRAILESHFDVDDTEAMAIYRRVLSWILLVETSQRRTTFAEIAKVLLPGVDIDDLLSGFGSLMMGTIDGSEQPVRVLHTSFRDFVLDSDASGPFAISLSAESHLDLADACLQILNGGLRFNLCCLPSSFDLNDSILDLPERVEEHVSPGLQYACCSTASHLEHSTGANLARIPRIQRGVERFFQEKLLFWMEVCSCMRLGAEVPTAELQRYLVWIRKNNVEGLDPLVRDSIKFDNRFRDAIAASASQVYISGLVFSPRQSQVRRTYGNSFSHLCKLAGNAPDDDWPPGEPFVIHAPAEVLAISISPDGEHIASGLKDSTVCVWDVMTGRQVGPTYEGHEDAVSAVAYSPSGEVIASASNDRTIRLWKASTGEQIGDALTGHTLQVYSVVFSPDGKRLASASNDCTVRLWDPTTGQQVGLNVDGHTKSVWSVAFSPNCHVLASGSEDGTVRLWDTATCQQLGEPLGGQHGGVTSVAYSRDGKHIMACTDDTTIRVWDIESRQQVHDALRGHGAWPISIAYSPDENLVASGAQEYSVRLWDLETECQVSEALEGHEDPVTAVAFSPDGSRIVSSSMDRTIRIWEIPSGQHKSRVEHRKRHDICLGVTLSPNGRHLASAMLDGTIVLWDVSTGKQIGDVLRGHEERVTSVSFSPDGRSLASGSFDCTVRLWDVDTGKQMGVVRRELSDVHRVNCVTFSPDGRHALSGSDYGSLRIWTTADVQQYEVCTIWPPDSMGAILSAAYSPDGRRIACAVLNEPVPLLCDALTGERVATGFSGHIDTVTVVVYSPDGKLLATGSRDRTVRVWDAVTGHQVVEALTGHVAAITCVSFSPDGGHIVSCAEDSTIRVWETMTGKQVGHSLRGHCAAVDSVAFAPDGRTIVSSAANDSIRMWRTPVDGQDVGSETALSPRANFDLASDIFQDESGWLRTDAAYVLWVPRHLRRLQFASSPRHVGFVPRSHPHVAVDLHDAALGHEWAQIYRPAAESS